MMRKENGIGVIGSYRKSDGSAESFDYITVKKYKWRSVI